MMTLALYWVVDVAPDYSDVEDVVQSVSFIDFVGNGPGLGERS